MLKIFLTGDNHIGLRYASHEQASVIAGKRSEAFSDMVDAANREGCALFVIAGDLFENTYSTSKRDIKSLLTVLSCFRGTVVVLPGNHDYYDTQAKVWQYFTDLMAGYDNIMLLTDYRPYELTANGDEVVLYPALCTSLHSLPGQNNLGWIKNESITPDGRYHIGLAHGAIEGETIDNEGQYFLMTRAELESIPVDAWLIGHTHVPFPKHLPDELAPCRERIFNAGTHVQTDVSCNTEGQCFVIEIGDDKAVRAKRILSGNLRFFRKSLALTAGQMEDILRRALADIPDDSVVDLILSGSVFDHEYKDRDSLIGRELSRFIEGKYNDYALSTLISEDLIVSEFPETSFSARLLLSLMDEPKEAQLTYELLKSLKGSR